MSKDEFDFGDLKVIEIPVVGTNGKSYMLVEASGDSVARFNNARTKCMALEDGKIAGISGQGDLEMYLVSLCLFSVKDDGSVNRGNATPLGTLRSWPGRVISQLFDKAKEISEIDKDDDLESLREQYQELGERIAEMEEDIAKNVPESTEIGLSLPEKEE